MNKFLRYIAVIQLLLFSFKATGQNTLHNESIYLQTDREIYIAGEEMFFKSYCYYSMANQDDMPSKYAYLVLRNENNVVVSNVCLKLENNMFSGSIYLPDTLSTGRYQLVSYTNRMRNYAENNYFKKEILVANRFDKELYPIYSGKLVKDSTLVSDKKEISGSQHDLVKIVPEKGKYFQREKIKVALSALGLNENESAQLTVSVREKTYQQDPFQENINTVNNNKHKHLPEVNSVILEGRVLSADTKQPLPNVLVYLSTPDSIANLQLVRTDDEGLFLFQLNDYYNAKNLIINLPENPIGQIVLDDKYELKEPFKPARFFSDSLVKDYVVKSQNLVRIQKDYKSLIKKDLQDSCGNNNIPPLVYPPVENPVYPSDYFVLPDFVEISREIIPLVKTRKKELGYETKIFNSSLNDFFVENPLILLDGVPINSINQIINLGTEKINRIEVVPFLRFYGDESFPGILAIFSKNLEINNIAWQTPTMNVTYIQLQSQSAFIRPDYQKSDNLPDFRQLLYWNPNIILKPNRNVTIEFFASDNKGEFEIYVEGIASDGRLIKSKATINIDTNL